MVLTQWKVWDLFKNYIVKLNVMYLKSIYIYIVSCSLQCNTLMQHCFSVLHVGEHWLPHFCFQKQEIVIEFEKRVPMSSIQ